MFERFENLVSLNLAPNSPESLVTEHSCQKEELALDKTRNIT